MKKNETDEHFDKLIKNFSLRSPIFISEIDFFLNNGYHYNDAELHDLIHKKIMTLQQKDLNKKFLVHGICIKTHSKTMTMNL